MQPTRDRDRIRATLRRDPALHAYELGDLDEFFWPHTVWYAEGDAIALVYTAPAVPVLVALAPDAQTDELARLLERIDLPATLYAHVSPALVDVLARRYRISTQATHVKMALVERRRLLSLDALGDVAPLGPADRDELLACYATAYPENWFDPRMLETGMYFAIRERGAIAAVAGVHVYSASERVAALGNIATDPAHRRRGLAAQVTSRLCHALLEDVDVIGLNVKQTNDAAIACYEQLGFARVAPYVELALEARV